MLEADHIVIASGSTPITNVFPGSELCWTSDDVFSMEEVPKSVAVIGGGYIGIEMAGILCALGSKVTLLSQNGLLGIVDKEIVETVIENNVKLGLEFKLNTKHESISKLDNGLFRIKFPDGSILDVERVLSAVGRRPNLDGMQLQNAGVKIERNAVVVDEYQNTSVPGIYAIGDATNQVNLTPVAIRQGRLVAERIFNNKPDLKMKYDSIPSVIFSHPPTGMIGITEEQARKKYGSDHVKVYKSRFVNMFYSPGHDDKKLKSIFKLICHVESDGTERIVGVFGHGKGVDEMIQGLSIAFNMGATKQDFDNSVAIHPTASEEWVLMDAKFLF